MSDTGMKQIARGHGWHNTGAAIAAADYGGTKFEGRICVWAKDKSTPSAGESVASVRGAQDVVTIIVRNVSGITLAPKQMVTWKTGYRGRRVDGYARLTAAEVAGVVDDKFSANGVPDGELFHLVVKGPCLVKTSLAGDATNVIADGGKLVAETAAASTGTTAGRLAPQDLTGATALLADQVQNCIGAAMSANTTAQTDRDLLVDLRLL